MDLIKQSPVVEAIVDAFHKTIAGLCGQPDQLDWVINVGAATLSMHLYPTAEDYGSICGKAANTIRALQYLFHSAGRVNGLVAELKLHDPWEAHSPNGAKTDLVAEPYVQPAPMVVLEKLVKVCIDPPALLKGTRGTSDLSVRLVAPNCDAAAISALRHVFNCYGKRRGIQIRIER